MALNCQVDSGKKIALARDIYSNAQVEFLDEPTAAIDAKSENEIYKHFFD